MTGPTSWPSPSDTEAAVSAHLPDADLDLPAAHTVSTLYRAANEIRSHLTHTVLRRYGLSWTGFVVLWTVWIWDGPQTREVAELVGVSKATLTGVVQTLERRGWVERHDVHTDHRLVRLTLTEAGTGLMRTVYPEFNAAQAEVLGHLSDAQLGALVDTLRGITARLPARRG